MASDKDRLTQSPRAIREGNREPKNVHGSDVQLGQNEPKKDGGAENRDAWKFQDDEYQNKYA